MKLKRIGFFLVVIVAFFIINSLVHSLFTLWQKRNLLQRAQEQLVQEEKQNQSLKKKLSVASQPQFVEEQARDKLFLAKPGEKIVLIPQQYQPASSSAASVAHDSRPNWKQWWDMFF